MCTMVLVFYYPVLRTTYIHMYMYYTYIEIIHTYIDLDLLVIFVPERASVHSSSMVPGAPLLIIITFQALRTGPARPLQTC